MEPEDQFFEISQLIQKARYRALKSVNTELINLYWQVGEYISKKVEYAEWGMAVVSELAIYLKKTYPDLKGFSDKNLWRMKQFYETYRNCGKLSALLRELSWTNKLNFYLEALDRDVKKPHENPSVGVILCKSRDTEVVEYAMSRNLSPALVAEYRTKLIAKRILQQKLHELFRLSDNNDNNAVWHD